MLLTPGTESGTAPSFPISNLQPGLLTAATRKSKCLAAIPPGRDRGDKSTKSTQTPRFHVSKRTPPVTSPARRVAVCVDKSRKYGRGVLQGIADFAQANGTWSIYVHPRSTGRYRADWLRDWHGDGVLAFIEEPKVADALSKARIPAVELFGHRLDLGLPHVGNDEEAFGRLAAEHLLERRFKNFAFFGIAGALWSNRRHAGFADALQKANPTLQVTALICEPDDDAPLGVWDSNQEQVARWLSHLPKPLGLLGASDRLALRILHACRCGHISVPEEIAVIGVDNDEEICRLADPLLTSVMDDARKVGNRAAELLDLLMSEPAQSESKTIFIPPLGIATRRSTESTALDDPLVARACRIIREKACSGLTVQELVQALNVSKSHFYQRFRTVLNRLPHEEILRARLRNAQSLLRETQLPVEEIALRCGFEHPEYLNVAFKRELGASPSRFRRDFRSR